MIVRGGTLPHNAQSGRTPQGGPAIVVLAGVSLLFVAAMALLWQSLVDRVQTGAAYEAAVVEAADRHRLLQLDAGALRQQLGAAEQNLGQLRSAIPSAREAQAELARYALYAAESGVSAETEPGAAIRQANADPAFPELISQHWQVRARGQARDAIRFLDRIITGRFASWRIENVVLKPDDSLTASAWDVVATADVVVYSYADRETVQSLHPNGAKSSWLFRRKEK